MRFITSVSIIIILCGGCSSQDTALINEAQQFLDNYTEQLIDLSYTAEQAEWQSNIEIIEGDTVNAAATNRANEAEAEFTGSVENIERARHYLGQRKKLQPLQVKQFEAILYKAADNPGTVPDLVKERIAAETAQVETLYGFDFKLDGKSVTTSDIDEILGESNDLPARMAAWTASKEVGINLKPGLEKLVDLRNGTVQNLGYDDYFQYQVSDYGMTTDEMIEMMDKFNRELRPLYRELHTYFRYTLAEKYGAEVPAMLPAHWLPNRWGQDWGRLITVEGLDLDEALAEKDAEWLARQAERFYISLGYDPLPASFWELSSLYPLPPGTGYKKNSHASAWHMDLKDDIRSLMSIKSNQYWYETVHHEYGHIYYYMAYTSDNVPPLLRGGANRGYHEGIGTLLGLASMQKSFIDGIGLETGSQTPDPIQNLLKESLNYVVFTPWSCGVMTHFEHELYSKPLNSDEYNQRWWELKTQYQGISAPEARGEEYCDAASKTHINNDAAQYYDYAVSNILLFQLHDYIAKEILHQDPHETNYFGNQDAGQFIWSIMETGATEDWRKLLKEKTGEDLSARAMLAYFQPLMDWLVEQNSGRTHTLADI